MCHTAISCLRPLNLSLGGLRIFDPFYHPSGNLDNLACPRGCVPLSDDIRLVLSIGRGNSRKDSIDSERDKGQSGHEVRGASSRSELDVWTLGPWLEKFLPAVAPSLAA